MLGLLLYLILMGLIAGAVARLLVPGRDRLGVLGTMALGIVGSFVGGFLGYVLFAEDFGEGALQPSGLIGSVLGSIVALLIYRMMNKRGVLA